MQDGGLYDKLYLALYTAVSHLTKLAEGTNESSVKKNDKKGFDL
jgi:hypothetical protein